VAVSQSGTRVECRFHAKGDLVVPHGHHQLYHRGIFEALQKGRAWKVLVRVFSLKKAEKRLECVDSLRLFL
jgi:hypothetical protein